MARISNPDDEYDDSAPAQPRPGNQRAPSAPSANGLPAATSASATAQPKKEDDGGVLGFIFGNGKDPGLLGTGQYDVGTTRLEHGDQLQNDIRQRMAGVDARTAPTMDTSRADQFRSNQMALAGDLLAASRGQGPSVAQEQLRQGLQSNLAGTVAAANSVRGPGAGAGVGQLLASRAMQGQQTASDAALLRANEVTQARGLLGQVAGQARGQDLDTAQTNLQAQMETQRQKDAMVTDLMKMGLTADQANMQAELELKRLKAGNYNATAANRRGLISSVLGAAGAIIGMPALGKGGGGDAAPDTSGPYSEAPQLMS